MICPSTKSDSTQGTMTRPRILMVFMVMFALSQAGSCDPLSRSAGADTYFGVAALFARCGVPGPCERPLRCEGETVCVAGRVDYRNVFDRARFPSLPYEKFLLLDFRGPQTLDVWAVAADNRAIFKKLLEHREGVDYDVFLRGKVIGVDMPTMGACLRGIKLEIRSVEDLSFRFSD